MKLLLSAAIALQILHFTSAQGFQNNGRPQPGELSYPSPSPEAEGKNVNINKITIAIGDDDDPKGKPKHPHWDGDSDCDLPPKKEDDDTWGSPQQGLGPRDEGLEARKPCPKEGCGHKHHSNWIWHYKSKTTSKSTSTSTSTSVSFPVYTWSFTTKTGEETAAPTRVAEPPRATLSPLQTSQPAVIPPAGGAGTCPATCDPTSGKNFCDVSTSCIGISGSKYLCACAAGFRASDTSPTDSIVQVRVDGFPWVLIKPGQKCSQLCTKQSAPDWCGEVPVDNKCKA
ncbi:uncharacterized protein BDZ99DRAFT_2182 [Mytilinidion resinicola]|uniref:EGF-like domain-containing protein n=1 Tax=Mytilinidion resinicola TaxID=574789 RepID=A0A6A6Z702_9PEZI|nr:uncharacterized protein BDZ99DRAFT_2182 [Mytilinidion resinicola]KAF2816810.1 hypothetical protein BDZ99DRAFT_2182 [Mytilinidion resinicola]